MGKLLHFRALPLTCGGGEILRLTLVRKANAGDMPGARGKSRTLRVNAGGKPLPGLGQSAVPPTGPCAKGGWP